PQTMNGIGSVNDLNAFEHQRVDSMTVAGAVPQRVGLGYAIHHVKRAATAQALAAVGELLTTGRKTGDQVAKYRGKVVIDADLLAEGLLVDQGDRIGNGTQRPFTSTGSH